MTNCFPPFVHFFFLSVCVYSPSKLQIPKSVRLAEGWQGKQPRSKPPCEKVTDGLNLKKTISERERAMDDRKAAEIHKHFGKSNYRQR